MSNMFSFFVNYVKFDVPVAVRIGDGKYIHAIGKGEIHIVAFDGKKWVKKKLVDVLYVPLIKLQLFSFGTALDKGLTFTADQSSCRFSKGETTVAVGERKGKLFQMKFKVIWSKGEFTPQANVAGLNGTGVLMLWHERAWTPEHR